MFSAPVQIATADLTCHFRIARNRSASLVKVRTPYEVDSGDMPITAIFLLPTHFFCVAVRMPPIVTLSNFCRSVLREKARERKFSMKTCLCVLGLILLAYSLFPMVGCEWEERTGSNEFRTGKDRLAGIYKLDIAEVVGLSLTPPDVMGTLRLSTLGSWSMKFNIFTNSTDYSGPSWSTDLNVTYLTLISSDGESSTWETRGAELSGLYESVLDFSMRFTDTDGGDIVLYWSREA